MARHSSLRIYLRHRPPAQALILLAVNMCAFALATPTATDTLTGRPSNSMPASAGKAFDGTIREPSRAQTTRRAVKAKQVTGAQARQGQSEMVLRIASWDLSTANTSIFAPLPKPKNAPWRTTFGSERKDRKKKNISRFNVAADFVLLQGVRNIRSLRKVFPARVWRLVLSRDYLRSTASLSRLPADLRAYDIAAQDMRSKHPVTAIAIRYQRRVRVRGVQHLSFDRQSVDGSKQHQLPAGTAVRIAYRSQMVWLLSLVVPQACATDVSACTQWQDIVKWRQSLQTGSHRVIAGTAPDTASSLANQSNDTCPQYLLQLQNSAPTPKKLPTEIRKRKDLGCLAIGTVPFEPQAGNKPQTPNPHGDLSHRQK